MLIRNKRSALAQIGVWTGFWPILHRLARQPVLIIFNYHRIGDARTAPGYRPVFSATAAGFDLQMDWLQRTYPILNDEQLRNWLNGRNRPAGPAVMITFDDGTRDQYDFAFPVLRDKKIPAWFFLPTDFLDHPKPFWWDAAAYLIARAAPGTYDFPGLGPEGFRLTIPDPPADRTHALDALIARALLQRPLNEDAFEADLSNLAKTIPDFSRSALTDNLFMTWDHVRELRDAGMMIGSHTCSHPRLGDWDESRQRQELTRSRDRIAEELGRPPNAVAYPYGTPDAATQLTRELALSAGYEWGLCFAGGCIRASDWDPNNPLGFAGLQRIGVGYADTLPLLKARCCLLAVKGRSPL